MLPITVVVIDDQTIFREMLVEILRTESRFRVLGQYGTGAEGLERCLALRPNVVTLDLVLPDMSGLDVLRSLRKRLPRTRVVVVTAHERAPIIQQAAELGAHGIVTKGAPLRELRDGIERVANGGVFRCAATSEVLRALTTRSPGPMELSPRQRQIVQLVASGLTTKEIAEKLKLSTKTVSNHRSQLMQRLGLRDVASLTRYAIAQGLVESAPPEETS